MDKNIDYKNKNNQNIDINQSNLKIIQKGGIQKIGGRNV